MYKELFNYVPKFKLIIQTNDPLKQFLEDKIEITNIFEDQIASSVMYETFAKSNEGKKNILSQTLFKDKLAKKNIEAKRTKKGVFFIGVKFIEDKAIENMFINELDA